MYPTWNLVRARYPDASLVFVWGDGVEFHMNGHRYLATFNESETAIDKVERID